MRKSLLIIALTAIAGALAAGPASAMKTIEEHQELSGPYADGSAVTTACLDCHEDAAKAFMKTSHWTWEPTQNVVGKGVVTLGKKNTINNFCIAITSNWPRCTSCHAGYGWKDDSFDFSDATKVDCLVCHDQTGKYRKFPTGAGDPVYSPPNGRARSGSRWTWPAWRARWGRRPAPTAAPATSTGAAATT